ncbi:ImmA/IrrE family metallo-endopeptidase [Streptomyces kronopolitis]|uniref:ImmA/IrrE family metallo-endopeptidase n=1 Tax=Streptomyces kronopolitis TaxID=1612435 RepID=UPI0034290B54
MAKPEAAAAALVADLGLRPPVDPAEVARTLSAVVVTQPGAEDLSGMLLRRDGQLVIGANGARPIEQQRFAVAHCLGHLRLHPARPVLVCTDRRAVLGAYPGIATDREEAGANRFAAALLMPESAVRDAASRGDFAGAGELAEAIAAAFGVSVPVATFRLLYLGITASG